MDLDEAKSALESILFVADEPVTVARLADALEVERDLVREAARGLAADHSGRGLRVQFEDDSVQMVTAPEAPRLVMIEPVWLGLRVLLPVWLKTRSRFWVCSFHRA